MENMFKQLRVRFSSLGDDSQQTAQNKSGNRKKGQNWFGRQLSGRSADSSSSDGEFETVIAASAFAVTSLGEVDLLNQKKALATRQTSLSKEKNRKEETMVGPPPDTRKASKKITGQTSMKKPQGADQKPTESVRRTPTFSGTGPDAKAIVKPESGKGTIPKPSVSFKEKHATPTPNMKEQTGSTSIGGTETKADIWEKAQMAKIEKRYQKLKSTILSWENEKQSKARSRLAKKERTLELKRARVQQEYRNEMERINRIAGGAREVAEERRKSDGVETKEKARILRTTGKMPVTCFCF